MGLTYERLHEVLKYNKDTGIFTRRISVSGNALAGDIAGYKNSLGYIEIGVDGKDYKAHRLGWLYHYGYFPENNIDHINRDRADNRLENLREASKQCNARNSKMRKDNTSGIKGVNRVTSRKKWQAQIAVNQKNINLGYFDSKLDAARARMEAEEKYNFSDCNTFESSAYKYILKFVKGGFL